MRRRGERRDFISNPIAKLVKEEILGCVANAYTARLMMQHLSPGSHTYLETLVAWQCFCMLLVFLLRDVSIVMPNLIHSLGLEDNVLYLNLTYVVSIDVHYLGSLVFLLLLLWAFDGVWFGMVLLLLRAAFLQRESFSISKDGINIKLAEDKGYCEDAVLLSVEQCNNAGCRYCY